MKDLEALSMETKSFRWIYKKRKEKPSQHLHSIERWSYQNSISHWQWRWLQIQQSGWWREWLGKNTSNLEEDNGLVICSNLYSWGILIRWWYQRRTSTSVIWILRRWGAMGLQGVRNFTVRWGSHLSWGTYIDVLCVIVCPEIDSY